MKIFDYAEKICEAYDELNYDEKAEFSENIKTASQCGSILLFGSIALSIFKMLKK